MKKFFVCKFERVKLCLFVLNLSIKPVKKFFVYKCKLSLSLASLYLVDLFINKLKIKFNNLFYRMILNTKITRSEEISPQKLNKCLQSFICRQEKATTEAVRSLRAKIVIVGNSK